MMRMILIAVKPSYWPVVHGEPGNPGAVADPGINVDRGSPGDPGTIMVSLE